MLTRFFPGILTPMDEFQYWADAAGGAGGGRGGEERERAGVFSAAFQPLMSKYATLETQSMDDALELVEETQDVLDDVWKQTEADKPYPEARMKHLLEVIGRYPAD